MANAEMAANCSHSESNADFDGCVIQMQERVTKRKQCPRNETSALIFRLHKVRSYDEQYFFPRLVSIGPYHFGKTQLANMEEEKDEAMLRMERRIQKRLPQLSMKSIVESDIVAMDQKIRDFYADEIPYSATALAWMATRDACFIFELLLNFPRCTNVKERSQEDIMVSVKHSNIFDGCYVTPTLQNLLVDCFLFENQIPGFVLERLLELKMGSQNAAKEKVVQMMDEVTNYFWKPPFTWHITNACKDASYLLEALYFETLGSSGCWSNEAYSVKQSQVFCLPYNYVSTGLEKQSQVFCLSYNYVSTCLEKYAGWMNGIFRRPCIQCSQWIKSFGLGFLLQSSSGEEISPSLITTPRAVELNRAGVRFHAVHVTEIDKGAGIMWIRFDPKTSTLYLPKMNIAPYDEYIMRNFIALENSSDKYPYKVMTVFLKFMDELIDNEEDVAVLVERGVIDNFLGSNAQVAELFNSIAMEYRYLEGFKPIDDAKIGLIIHQRRNYKILWSQFVEAYFSKPWIVALSIGVVLLLLLIIVVIGLFCEINAFSVFKSG